MKLFIASDHAGFQLKSELIRQKNLKYSDYPDIDLIDLGTAGNESCDYPVFANKLVENLINASETDRGILICGTGIDTLYRLGYDKDKNLLISETAPGDYGMIYNSTFPVGTDGSRIFTVNCVKHTEMVNNEEVLNKILEFLKRVMS